MTGAALFAVALGGYLALVVIQPVHWSLGDLQVYRLGGLVARRSGPLYTTTFVFYKARLPFTYPPMAALVFAVMSFLPLITLKVIMTVANLLALLWAAWLCWGTVGVRALASRASASLAVAGVALWTDPVQRTLSFGQVNLILMVIVLADLLQRDGRRWKGAGVGIAAGLKLTPAIFIVYLLITRRFRAAVTALCAFGLTIAAGFALLPGQSRQFWLGGLFLNGRRPGDPAFLWNQSLYGTLVRLAGGTGGAAWYAWAAAATVTGVTGLLLAAWAHQSGRELLGIVTCAVTGLLVSPISWDHHWVWVVPLLILAASPAAGWRPASRRLRTRVIAWGGPVAVVAVFGAYPMRTQPGPVYPLGLMWTVPVGQSQVSGWHGWQLIAGNLYMIAGLVVLAAAALINHSIRSRPSGPSGSQVDQIPADAATKSRVSASIVRENGTPALP